MKLFRRIAIPFQGNVYEGVLFMAIRISSNRMFFVSILTLFLFFGFVCASAQNRNSVDAIVINSWQKGEAFIMPRELSLTLSGDEYNFDAFDQDQNRVFRFVIQKLFIPSVRKPNPQCVMFQLKEVFDDKPNGIKSLGSNLFLTGSELETSAHIICPIDQPFKPLDNGFASVYSPRIFNIEKFVVTIKALKFEYDSHKNRLSSMSVHISLSNRRTIDRDLGQ